MFLIRPHCSVWYGMSLIAKFRRVFWWRACLNLKTLVLGTFNEENVVVGTIYKYCGHYREILLAALVSSLRSLPVPLKWPWRPLGQWDTRLRPGKLHPAPSSLLPASQRQLEKLENWSFVNCSSQCGRGHVYCIHRNSKQGHHNFKRRFTKMSQWW